MPIYEFYCAGCNTIFNFFSGRVNTEKRPKCPKCDKGPLERVISRFAVLKGVKEHDDMEMPELDETKLGKAMSLLEREAKNLNKDDPRQAAHLMRKLCDTTGLNLGSGMEEALRRMEAGEDPEKIEEEIGDILNEEDFFNLSSKASKKIRKNPPERDETLYYL
ncbi:MAG: zinc ribbon domain-containing protein [Nitrospirota bacterium]